MSDRHPVEEWIDSMEMVRLRAINAEMLAALEAVRGEDFGLSLAVMNQCDAAIARAKP